MNTALLIIDMQKGCREATRLKNLFDEAVGIINETSRLFRENCQDVIIIQDREVGQGPGSESFSCVDDLQISQIDSIIYKDYNNAFWKTGLDELLKDKGIHFLVLCGFAAEYCVLFTWNGAMERDYTAVLLQNGIAGFDENEVKSIQLHRPVISHEALSYLIKA